LFLLPKIGIQTEHVCVREMDRW